MSAKCALAQCRCYTKWENSKCIIGKLIKFKVKKGKHPWTTPSRRLITRIENRKKEYGNNIKQFYWDRDVINSSFLFRKIYLNILQIFRNWKFNFQI